MAISQARKLWSVEEYERMIELGLITEDDRVELIRGEILEMAASGTRHMSCVTNLDGIFHELLGRSVVISVQNSILLPNNSMPEPDVALLRGKRGTYARRRPTVDDVLLLVEVSDSTLGSDRRGKLPLYAEAGIAEVWLVNPENELIEVYSEPVDGQYRSKRLVGRGERVALPAGLQGSVSVDEVLEAE